MVMVWLPLLCMQGHFMYVSNLDEYGHLLNADNFDTSHLNNDMYMIFDNRLVGSKLASDYYYIICPV